MGYTHYWTQSRDFTLEEWPQTREDFGLLLKDVEHVEGIPVANGIGERGTSPEFTHEYILFNGAGDRRDLHPSYLPRISGGDSMADSSTTSSRADTAGLRDVFCGRK